MTNLHETDRLVERLREALVFINKVGGTTLGIAMSGSRHPKPDEVLTDLSRESMDLASSIRDALTAMGGKAVRDRIITALYGNLIDRPEPTEDLLQALIAIASRATAMGGKADTDWLLVPREPTIKMLEAGGANYYADPEPRPFTERAAAAYRAMIAASASPVQARTGEVTDEMVARAEAAVYPRHERGFLSKPLIDPIDMRKALEAALSEPPKA